MVDINIRYIVLDVDGTLTDGGIFYGEEGQEFKRFDVKDGLMIKSAQKVGIEFIVMTGRISSIVTRRMKELGISQIFQGVLNKKEWLERFLKQKDIETCEVAYIGDDLNDLQAMKICGFKACPNDARTHVKDIADYIADSRGGYGAVSEIIEVILKKRELWGEVDKIFSTNL